MAISAIGRFLERKVPEKRLFLRTDTETRFVRLAPMTQIMGAVGSTLLVSWAIVATAIILMDSIGSGNFREQARRDQLMYIERLNAIADERNSRAEEAAAAQERFSTALKQVSGMQTELLTSEERRRELERGLETLQAKLQTQTLAHKKTEEELGSVLAYIRGEAGGENTAGRAQDLSQTLAFISQTLSSTAQERDSAVQLQSLAEDRYAEVDRKLQVMEERNDEIFRKLEDAMTISVKPLDRMFSNAGLSTTSLLNTVRRGYSGQGGLTGPLRFSTAAGAIQDDSTKRANNILSELDKLNLYRIAAQKAPFAMPVRGAYRRTSGFGPRWGRMHRGTDFAAAHGSPIYSTADGVVTFAGWGSGYGRLIKIQHEFGIETRYAHLSRLRVKKGQRVSRGQRIGDMGNTGRSTGTHLHYEVRVGGRAVNPEIYIKAANNVF